eukprot:403340163
MGCAKSTQSHQNKNLKASLEAQKTQDYQEDSEKLIIEHPTDLKDYQFSINDIFHCVRYGDYNKLDWILTKFKIENIFALRGFQRFEKQAEGEFTSKSQNQANWNVLLIAIYYRQHKMVQYFMQEHHFPLKLALLDPLEESKSNFENEIFGLKIAIHNKDLKTLRHLWVKRSRWEIYHLDAILDHLLKNQERFDSISKPLMNNENTQDIFACLSGQQADLTSQRYLQMYQQEGKVNPRGTKILNLREILSYFEKIALHVLVNGLEILGKTSLFNDIFIILANKITIHEIQFYHPSDYSLITPHLNDLQNFDDLASIPRPIINNLRRNLQAARAIKMDRDFNPQKYHQYYQFKNEMQVQDWFSESLKDIMPLEGYFLMGVPISKVADTLQENVEATVRRKIESMLEYKNNFRNVVAIGYQHEREKDDAFQVYRTISITYNLKVCLWLNLHNSLRALLDYYEFWGKINYKELADYLKVFHKNATEDCTKALINSKGFKACMQYIRFHKRDDIIRPFIRISQFKRTKDFTFFEKALKTVDPCILNYYCLERRERIMNLVPYLKSLDQDTLEGKHGKMLLKELNKLPIWDSVKDAKLVEGEDLDIEDNKQNGDENFIFPHLMSSPSNKNENSPSPSSRWGNSSPSHNQEGTTVSKKQEGSIKVYKENDNDVILIDADHNHQQDLNNDNDNFTAKANKDQQDRRGSKTKSVTFKEELKDGNNVESSDAVVIKKGRQQMKANKDYDGDKFDYDGYDPNAALIEFESKQDQSKKTKEQQEYQAYLDDNNSDTDILDERNDNASKKLYTKKAKTFSDKRSMTAMSQKSRNLLSPSKTVGSTSDNMRLSNSPRKWKYEEVDERVIVDDLVTLMQNSNEQDLKQLFSKQKSMEFLFLKAKTNKTFKVATTVKDQHDEMQPRQSYSIPPAIYILSNNSNFEEGASLLFKILITNRRFELLQWIIDASKGVFTMQNFITAIEVMIAQEQSQQLNQILNSPILRSTLSASSFTMRKRFDIVMKKLQRSNLSQVYNAYSELGYSEYLNTVQKNREVYDILKKDDVKAFEVQLKKYNGVGDCEVVWLDKDNLCPQIIVNGQPIDKTKLNLEEMCLLLNAPKCLNLIFTKHLLCVRECLKGDDSGDLSVELNSHRFDTQAVALLSQSKNLEILQIVLKQDGFVISPRDFQSLFSSYVNLNFKEGIIEMLGSPNIQMTYCSMSLDQENLQKPMIFTFLIELEYQNYAHHLYQRPYLTACFNIALWERNRVHKHRTLSDIYLREFNRDDFEILYYKEREHMMMDTVFGEFHAWDKRFQANTRETIERFKEEYYSKIPKKHQQKRR